MQYDEHFVIADNGLMDIALSGHYSKPSDVTTELSDMLAQLPNWTVPIGWLATYEAWIIWHLM